MTNWRHDVKSVIKYMYEKTRHRLKLDAKRSYGFANQFNLVTCDKGLKTGREPNSSMTSKKETWKTRLPPCHVAADSIQRVGVGLKTWILLGRNGTLARLATGRGNQMKGTRAHETPPSSRERSNFARELRDASEFEKTAAAWMKDEGGGGGKEKKVKGTKRRRDD